MKDIKTQIKETKDKIYSEFIRLLETEEIMKVIYLLFVIQKIKSNSKLFRNLLEKHKDNFNIDLLINREFISNNIKKISIMMLLNLFNNSITKEYAVLFKNKYINNFQTLNDWFKCMLSNLDKIVVKLSADKLFVFIIDNDITKEKGYETMERALIELNSNITEWLTNKKLKHYVNLYKKYNSKYALDYMYISNIIDELGYLILFVYLSRKDSDLVKKLNSIPNDILTSILANLSKRIKFNITKNKLHNFLYYINKTLIKNDIMI